MELIDWLFTNLRTSRGEDQHRLFSGKLNKRISLMDSNPNEYFQIYKHICLKSEISRDYKTMVRWYTSPMMTNKITHFVV